ncbi:O-antigen ligase family protein [Bosea sp. (in: a-proteobacteria)]|uniref:O-antigen ligase family protein n=1 Tax=Bosea sp. (in: a-proteobacteria) TaxID=1871050 RepID=UPI002DDD6374|nr:O-antigen ligase family protein [Bosea sp. (in: a-proteobacteria)]HEV2513082.1 O-antigen ligase family protein [Bosea sp. (in: a-proteobacteria)]
MSSLAHSPGLGRRLRISHAALQRGALWLLTASSWVAIIEPSPYEIAFLLVLAVFVVTGIRLSRALLPLALLLLGFNLGGAISLIPWMNDPDAVRFIAVSFYLMVTAIVLAAVMADDTQARLEALKRGYLFATWCTGLLAIVGYFDIAGLGDHFTLWGRATGTFKDPNVLGPFLVLPIAFVLHDILVGRRGLVGGLCLISVPLAALFLTFSRGAWGNLAAAVLLMAGLTFLTAETARMRARIVALALTSLLLAAVTLAIALSFDVIREMFEVRASLDQSYDLGVTGRFGAQLRSIPMLLSEPNGFGPLRFRWLFLQQDPHNVYINAFASYGWLGGFCWLALTVATCWAGWWLVFRRGPLQGQAIALWSVLFVTILQGFQIDTDHWRHFYLMLGLVWGLAAIARRPDGETAP